VAGKAGMVGVKEFVAVKLGICVCVAGIVVFVAGIVVFVGGIEVVFAEHDAVITIIKNEKHSDFFTGKLSFLHVLLFYLIASSSTSNISVAFGGIKSPAPEVP
jgi:hypothetical protein